MLSTQCLHILFCRTIIKAIEKEHNPRYWVGLNDIASEGNWRWVNDHFASSSDFTLWTPGQPISSSSSYDCAAVQVDEGFQYEFLLYSFSCSNDYYPSICEKTL